LRRTATAILMCAVMVLVALVPMVSGGDYVIVKGPQGPRASAMTWTYEPMDYGVWTAKLDNYGLRSIVLDVYDNTSGALEQVLHQRIRFAAYDAYPSGIVHSNTVMMAKGHLYEITATPNGPRQSYAVISDEFAANKSPVANFTWTADYLTVSVDASASYDPDPDGSIFEYVWDWGDGSDGSGVTAVHTYAMAGVYTITLTVVDNLGSTGSLSKDVPVEEPPNQMPIASFTVLKDYLDVNVDASDSYDPDGTIVAYSWNWGDGSADEVSALPTAMHSYAMGGTYTIALTVTDNDGGIGTAMQEATVEPYVDRMPTAQFSYAVDYLVASFDASASSDDNGIVSHDWDFGDGMTGSGAMVTHEYSMSGTYTVVLTVTDTITQTDSAMADVTVASNPTPVAMFTISKLWLDVTVDATGSYDDHMIASYAWNFGDGGTAAGVTAAHSYSMDGTYTITLTVTDDRDLVGTQSQDVTVNHEPKNPVAVIKHTMSWMDVSVDGSDSYDDILIESYDWDFGDGATASGMTATHTYLAEGYYWITLTVTDNEGLTGSSMVQVHAMMEPVPPVPSFTWSADWLTLSVDASGSTDDGIIMSYDWNFGDSTTGSGVTATHLYLIQGTYTVTLTVTDDDLLSASTSQVVEVFAPPSPPVALFTPTMDWMDVSVDATASYDPDGIIVSYAWDFGDGASATGVTATHTYAVENTYAITLTVTDDDSLTATKTINVDAVKQPVNPTASFTVSKNFLEVTVDGSASSDDEMVVSYAWTFGDGAVAAGVSATHIYTADGKYEITLTVTDNDDLTGTASQMVDVAHERIAPVAIFDATMDWMTVSVDASASYDPDGSAITYAWDFGDGAAATGMIATHTYLVENDYLITLTVTDADMLTGTASTTVTAQKPPEPPIASFSVGTDFLAVSVDASASNDPDGTIVSYAWNFGDGSTGMGVTATHTYTAEGNYLIALTVTDNEGMTGYAEKWVLVNEEPKAPFAVISYTPDWLTVNVDGSGSYDLDGTIQSWAWTFGDGAVATGSTASHTYASDGSYTITLTVTDNEGMTGTDSVIVDVVHEPIPPTAAFTWSASWEVVSFDGSGSDDLDGTVTTWAWNFGDGSMGSGMTATHTYAASGSYAVTLTVTDNDALTDSITQTVTVTFNNPPVASFTVTKDYLDVFVDASASTDDFGIASYAWSYGDGGSGSGVMDSHTYAAAGTYLVTLTVVDTGGKSSTTSMSVSVVPNTSPIAAITLVSTNYLVVTLSGSGSTDDSGIASYAWNFGDGLTGSGVSVTHTYAASGSYTVTLTVTDDHGLTGSTTKLVTVEERDDPPDASFTYTVNGLTVSVDASGSTDDHGIASYSWDWGDGSTGSGVTATHTYAVAAAAQTSGVIINAEPPPYYVAGYAYDTDGAVLTSCVVKVTNTRTGEWGEITSSATTGLYRFNLWSLPSDFLAGDLINITATKGTMIGWNESAVPTPMGSYMTMHVTLVDSAEQPLEVTITLTVTDAKGQTDSMSQVVTLEMPKEPPLAAFTASVNNLAVQVDASTSSDPDGTIALYSWAFGDGGSATGVTASHTYAAAGTYTITLTVTDNDGLTDTATQSVTAVSQPTAAFTWSASWEVVSFDASGSTDADGTIVSWAWNFGDGATGSGMTAAHAYAASGTYAVTLTVTDDDGLTGVITKNVAVTYNTPPIASFTTTKDYMTIFVDASGSTDAQGIVSWTWNYGDGSSGSGVMDSHTYVLPGTYMITLTVTDTGGKTATVSKSVSPSENSPPTAIINVVSIVDLTATLSGSGSLDDATITTYAWNFGDSLTGSGVTVTHTYAVGGTYSVSLTVTDDHGASGSAAMDIVVAEPIPVPEKTFRLYDMFQEPWGWWWGPRWSFYLTDVVLSSEPGMNTMMFWPSKSALSPYSSIFYAPYRFSFDERNQSTLSVNKPEFMPVFGPTVAGASANVDIRFQYIDPTSWADYWIPTWGSFAGWPGDAFLYRSGADGYDLGTVYTVNMNRQAAEQWLNMPTSADPAAWWTANGATYKTNWVSWVLSEGNVRLDIFCGYEWPYDINGGTWMTMAEEADGSVTLTIGHIALGYEILMTRWFVETKLCALETYMEDFTLSAEYSDKGLTDVVADFVCQYSLHAVKQNKTLADDNAWVWEPAKIDYITKLGKKSQYTPYRSLFYTSWNAGDTLFGTKIPYEQTPGWFNLSENEKLIIQAPTTVVPGYKGVALPEATIIAAAEGDLSGINAIRRDGMLDLGYFRTAPNEVGQPDISPYWNSATKTLTLVGPMNFDNFRHKSGTTTPAPILAGNVLYHGTPWIEFNVVPVAASASTPGSEATLRGTVGPASIADSAPALAAMALASVVVLLVAVRRHKEE